MAVRNVLIRNVRPFSTSAPAGERNHWPPPQPPVAVALFDGSCPMCAREIAWLRTFRAAPRVKFVDISEPAFDEAAFFAAAGVAKPRVALVDEMHVLDPRARVLHARVPAFRVLYAALGHDVLSFTARAPWAGVADAVYELIRLHKHRVAWLIAPRGGS